ncbi:MAG: DUF4344 domain-containing metallopeptidase [Pseudomonadota bacterium]
MRLIFLALFFSAGAAVADENAFVEANILSIFYHELGHALIDIEELPVFGQEEDASDVLSILLIDAFWEAAAAETFAREAANGFWAEAAFRDGAGETIAWWAVHSPDERRFYNTVCLFYGADPHVRRNFAKEMGLPDERAETCEDEYDLAISSWGTVLDEMADRGGGSSFRYEGGVESLTERLIEAEVRSLNSEFQLAGDLTITIESCGEANAFYDPATAEVVMCEEMEDHLTNLVELLE